MKPRAKKKKLKKRFPYSDEFKQHKIGYMERLHKCPICGGSRRAGYYLCCSKCYWVYEWQNKVKGLVEQTSDMMREYDARLSVCFYTPYTANIVCEINAYCDPHEVTETHRNGERLTGEFKVEYKCCSIPRLSFSGTTRNTWKITSTETGRWLQFAESLFQR